MAIPARLSFRRPLLVSSVGLLSLAAIPLRWFYLHGNDEDLWLDILSFIVVALPFAFSILFAFVPDMRSKHIAWRGLVVLTGFVFSGVLWKQQHLAGEAARRDQRKAVNEAVQRSNQHSDEKIGEVRKDVQDVNGDLRDVKKDVQATISKTGSALSADINKVKIFPPSEKATYEVSLWPALSSNWPVREKSLPKVNGVVTFSFTVMVKSHMAEQARIWLRLVRAVNIQKSRQDFKTLPRHRAKALTQKNERLLSEIFCRILPTHR